jgi:ribulose-5-phosphate 4-epimerase/fuculose-1-phosphate aldolase
MDVSPAKLEELAAAGRRAAAYGLIRCSSGNLSGRLDADLMLVKASRAWMIDMTADDVALCRIADGSCLNGKKPSVEIGFHAGALRTRNDINVVLHFQSPAATTLACSDPARVDYFVIPEIPYYIGPIGIVPYILPGSVELAAAVTATLKNHNLAVLTNHGLVTVGKNFDEAIQRAVFFELACDILVRGRAHVRPLPPDAATVLRDLATANARGA